MAHEPVEVSLAPAVDSTKNAAGIWNYQRGGDCYFNDTSVSPVASLTTVQFGRDATLKYANQVTYGAASHYDTSGIPLNSVVNKAKLEMAATHTNTQSCTPDFDVLAISRRLNSSTFQTFDARFLYEPRDDGSSTLWANSALSGATAYKPILWQDLRGGLGSISQAWSPSSNGDVDAHWWQGRRWNIANGSGLTVRTAVYEAEGEAGDWRKGDLADPGAELSLDSVPTTANTSFFTLPEGTLTVDSTKTYVSELVFDGLDAASTGYLEIYWSTSLTGASENATFYSAAGRKLQGFGTGSNVNECWESGLELSNFAVSGTTDSAVNVGNFTASQIHEFGTSSGGYAGVVDLPNFTSNLQAALDARASVADWVGVRINHQTATQSSNWRRIRSARHATATRDSLFGMILTLDYTPPDPPLEVLTSKGSRTRAAVTARRSLAQTALIATTAARPAVTARRSTTQTALRSTSMTRSAITSRGGRIRR